jgi:hypothetical protein
MPKGRFLNQKLGKRTSRKLGLLKTQLVAQRERRLKESGRARKKGVSRESHPAV